jgi:hypothetical protein
MVVFGIDRARRGRLGLGLDLRLGGMHWACVYLVSGIVDLDPGQPDRRLDNLDTGYI